MFLLTPKRISAADGGSWGWVGVGVGWRVHTFTHTRPPTVSHAMFNRNRPHLVLQPLQSADETVERRVNGGSAFPPPITTLPPLGGWGGGGSVGVSGGILHKLGGKFWLGWDCWRPLVSSSLRASEEVYPE